MGIPKTIDHDIYLVSRSFGFDTAVDVATQAIKGAHNKSEGYPNGIGLIRLMGPIPVSSRQRLRWPNKMSILC
ncbi:MAG TPA: 6-phosphofructokinase [Desulfobacterales bacterium]|nr:6-phosphofructokinase [Desulfobacterales bacterium]